MSFTFDINKDPHFQMAREAGIKEGIQKGRTEGLYEGIEQGIEKGRSEGLYEGKSETAMRMLSEGFEIPVISRISGLSLDEIEALKRNMH